MTKIKFALSILPETMGICHLDGKSPVPEWIKDLTFYSVTKTSDELSLVCPQDKIPGGILFEKDWRAFKLEGDVGLESVGVIYALSKPLAEAGISIFNVSTFETNYIMVEQKNLAKAIEVLSEFCEIRQ